MSNFQVNIVFFGNGIRAISCLEKLIDSGKEIKAVVGQKPSNELSELAASHGIEYLFPKKVNSDEFVAQLKQHGCHLFVLCGYNKILREGILDLPKYGVVNCHGGKLPEYRGTAPINWQLINGEEVVGFTVLFADKGIDTGDLIREVRFPITQDTTASDLVNKSLEWFPDALESVITELEQTGRIVSNEQDEFGAVHYNRRYPEDGLINWAQMTDVEVHNMVRALVRPYPGAFTFLEGEKIVINKTQILSDEYRGVPGRVSLKTERGVIVHCKNRGLLIETLLKDNSEVLASDNCKIGQKFEQ